MLFTQIEFYIFFFIVLTAFYSFPSQGQRKALLLAANGYFYAYWDYRFLLLITTTTILDYHFAKGIASSRKIRKKKLLLAFSITASLLFLFFFKYFNMLIDGLKPLAEIFGISIGHLDIILPLGISFYTFQTISYVVDVYRGKMKPCDSLIDYAVFMSFFPKMVAGPIVRSADFLPQLSKVLRPTRDDIFAGSRLFIIGFFKKVFLADNLGHYVDFVFGNAGLFDCSTIWLAVAAYTLQIYFDFSGYTDMAIGVARAMGFKLPENFNFPYLSRSISDFWRRWHITLSNWIRDYLYIPLGGSRKSPLRTYLNLIVAMMLCGLWHGASMTFVFWGGIHGLALAVNRVWSNFFAGRNKQESNFEKIAYWFLTMIAVMTGWVFFKANSFGQALLILRQMFNPLPGINWIHPFPVFVLFATFGFHVIHTILPIKAHLLPQKKWYTPFALFCLIWLVLLFYPQDFNPFIYFQF